MKIGLSTKELQKLLDEKFGKGNEYELHFQDDMMLWKHKWDMVRGRYEARRMPNETFHRVSVHDLRGFVYITLYDLEDDGDRVPKRRKEREVLVQESK